MSRRAKKSFLAAGVFLVLFFAFTFLVQCWDVQAIGPVDPETGEATKVGMATLNGKVFNDLGGVKNEKWYEITQYIGYLSLGLVGLFGLIGFVQLVTRRSLFKVNPVIVHLGIYYIIILGLYFLFEKFSINCRTVLEEDGTLEASYPSSHTLMTVCVMAGTSVALRYLLRHRRFLRALCMFACLCLGAVMPVGRLIANVHWLTDILGGLLLSTSLILFYNGFARQAVRRLRRKHHAH